MSKYRVFSGSNTGKCGPEETPYLNTSKPSGISKMEIFVKVVNGFNSRWLFSRKAPSKMFGYEYFFFKLIVLETDASIDVVK